MSDPEDEERLLWGGCEAVAAGCPAVAKPFVVDDAVEALDADAVGRAADEL
jgi:hypothetical protein